MHNCINCHCRVFKDYLHMYVCIMKQPDIENQIKENKCKMFSPIIR